MRPLVYCLLLCSGAFLLGAERLEIVTGASLLAPNEVAQVVEFTNGEAQISSPFFARIALGRDSVAVTVKNTLKDPVSPALSLEFFNKDGMLVSAVDVPFAGEVVQPGDVGVRQVKLVYPEIETIFRRSSIKLPDDWKTCRFVKVVTTATPMPGQPTLNPSHPRPQPQAMKQQRTRPAIFVDDQPGQSKIGATAVNARWSNYGAYLQRLIDTVQVQWENILISGKIYPPAGSTVTVTFVIDSEGQIARIGNVDNKSSEQASHACVSAITDRAPYGPWTADMIATLGKEQELTFTFYYQ